MNRVPFLRAGNIAAELAIENGYPDQNDQFQSNIPGLYFTSMPATRDFGAFSHSRSVLGHRPKSSPLS